MLLFRACFVQRSRPHAGRTGKDFTVFSEYDGRVSGLIELVIRRP